MSPALIIVIVVVLLLLYGGNVFVPADGRPRALTILVVLVLAIWLLGGFGGWWGPHGKFC